MRLSTGQSYHRMGGSSKGKSKASNYLGSSLFDSDRNNTVRGFPVRSLSWTMTVTQRKPAVASISAERRPSSAVIASVIMPVRLIPLPL